MTSSVRPPVRVGILGAGAISQLVHLPILTAREDAVVVALADQDRLKAETIAARFGVASVADEDQAILSDPNIDAVLVCTPTYLHEAHAVEALTRGKHVLVERPLATTAQGARNILDAAEKHGCSVMMNTAHRLRADAIALYSFVAGGELGSVYQVRGSLLNRKLSLARNTWRVRSGEAGGGALMDLGVPIIDLCLWLVGYPEVARVSAVLHRGDFEVEEAAAILAETRSGIALAVDVSWSLFADRDRYQAQVLGTRGSGALPPLTVFRQIGGRPLSVTPHHPQTRDNAYMASHRRLLDRFLGSVTGERAADPPSEQVRLMEVIEAAYRSAENDGDVALLNE